MAVSKELLEAVKLYCKIDFDFEDSIVEEMIESAQEQICFAIEAGSKPEDLQIIRSLTLLLRNKSKKIMNIEVLLLIAIVIRWRMV